MPKRLAILALLLTFGNGGGGMNPGIRMAAWNAGGGNRTPRPVEYIESDGNQWVDIVVASRGSNTGTWLDYTLLESTTSRGLFGSGTVNGSLIYDLKHIIVGGRMQRFDRYDRSTNNFNPRVGERQTFEFNPKGNNSSQPYKYYSSLNGYIRQYDNWYSGTYSISNSVLRFFSVYNRADFSPIKMRFHGFELRDYSSATVYTTTLKLSPVSVGGVGAILDEITGETYFNMGTGNFVVGPDKNA